MDNQEYNFEYLLQQLPEGDPRLREALVETWYPYIRALVTCLIEEPLQADFALIETIEKAWTRVDRYPIGSGFKAWLTRILLEAVSRYSKSNPAQSGKEAGKSPEPAEKLRRDLVALPPDLRFPAALYLLAQIEVSEISQILKVREKSAYERLERAISLLVANSEEAGSRPSR